MFLNFIFLLYFLAISFMGFDALADVPHDWQIGLQDSVTETMDEVVKFHDFVMIYAIGISIFVGVLLFYTVFRFHHTRNPYPSRFTHNNLLEVVWTVIPVIIVLSIIYPSMKLLYKQETIPEDGLTVKVMGYQWYWGYDYPDYKISFDSYMKQDEDLSPGEYRLLEVDNRMVVPVNTNVRVQVTSNDVIHSWTIPAFGVKNDAVPGRLNEIWFNARKIGVYYGQCSELCGVNHGFMPIVVEVVSEADFARWIDRKKKDFSYE